MNDLKRNKQNALYYVTKNAAMQTLYKFEQT